MTLGPDRSRFDVSADVVVADYGRAEWMWCECT
jgi:hypothetical protein